jgi:hypothetical protein
VRQLRLGQAQLGTPGANDVANIDQVHGWHRPRKCLKYLTF